MGQIIIDLFGDSGVVDDRTEPEHDPARGPATADELFLEHLLQQAPVLQVVPVSPIHP
jgi:hypothetical protein